MKNCTNSPKSKCLLCHAGASSGFIWGLPTIPHSLHSQYNISLLLNLFSWSYDQVFPSNPSSKQSHPPVKCCNLLASQGSVWEGGRETATRPEHNTSKAKVPVKIWIYELSKWYGEKQIAWRNIVMKEWGEQSIAGWAFESKSPCKKHTQGKNQTHALQYETMIYNW